MALLTDFSALFFLSLVHFNSTHFTRNIRTENNLSKQFPPFYLQFVMLNIIFNYLRFLNDDYDDDVASTQRATESKYKA